MSGTKAGGLRAAQTNKARYGSDFYQKIGTAGGKASNTGGFGSDKVGPDGLTGKQRAEIAGAKGGTVSRRNKASHNPAVKTRSVAGVETRSIDGIRVN